MHTHTHTGYKHSYFDLIFDQKNLGVEVQAGAGQRVQGLLEGQIIWLIWIFLNLNLSWEYLGKSWTKSLSVSFSFLSEDAKATNMPDTQSPYLLRVMNCRVNGYSVSLTFWQREKENFEEKRAREIMWKQRQKKVLSNRHRSRWIPSEFAWSTGFPCPILNHRLG